MTRSGPTSEQTADVILAIKAGARYRDAVISAGIDWRVGRDLWADPDWRAAVKKARASFETSALADIQAAQKDDWKAAAWALERIKSDRYGKKDKQEIDINIKAIPFRSVVDGRVFDAEVDPVKALPDKPAEAVVPPAKVAEKERAE